jgi:hypothetical protein
MLGEGGTPLSDLEDAARCFLQRGERGVDLKRYRALIDALEGDFASEARHVQQTGAHLADGNATVVTWISRLCGMSATSAADRICVGTQLEAVPKVAEALSSGEIGYQSASLLCHLRDQLGDKRDLFDEDEMLDLARRHSVASLRFLCRYARHWADPDGFFNEAEEAYSRRELHISQMPDGMHVIDGLLDPVGGAALRTALDSLAKRLGPDDDRTHKQRMADALGELTHHAMDEGRLPKRNGVKPHVSVTTTLEGLKNEFGVPAADLELSLPISTRTLERITCDSTISRVLLADSMVIDVGRATRVVSAPTRRALRVRDRGCRWPGCDRQVNWSTPHHIIAWARGGPGTLANLLLLCFFHHRLVHEGGWQVVKAGREFRFMPPERVVLKRARGPGVRWAV